MADTTNPNDFPLSREDLVSTGSRIAWGPIVAGSVLALAFFFLLSLLGAATGLSVSNNVDVNNIGIGAAIYAIVVVAFCLFVGGAVSTILTVGENKREAAIYGLLVWSLTFVMMLGLIAGGLRAGFGAMASVVTAGSQVAEATPQDRLDAIARDSGVDQADVKDLRAKIKAKYDEQMTPEKKQQALATGTNATWIAFAGVLVSMLAAVGGAMCGCGPTLRLMAIPVARGSVMRS
jgi:ABC-type transport system involved in multi-copper enzyme maturation permease subunit